VVRINLQKAVALHLAWLGVLSGAFIVMLSEVLPFRLTFVRPDNLFPCLLQCQTFFVVLVWPLFLTSLLREGAAAPEAPEGPGWVYLQVAVLAVFAFPLALIAANVSSVGPATLLGSQLRVGAWGALVAALFLAGTLRRRRTAPAYFLTAFLLSAVPPMLHFLVRELAGGPDLSVLRWVSPFWGTLDLDGAVWVQTAIVAALAGAAFAAAGKAHSREAATPGAASP